MYTCTCMCIGNGEFSPSLFNEITYSAGLVFTIAKRYDKFISIAEET